MYMGSLLDLLLAALLLATAIGETRGDALVTGTVFCDQCRDGERSLFDYPLSGVKVTVVCGGSNGPAMMWKEDTTNWFGSYAMKFEGSPDLSGCYAKVSNSGQDAPTDCGASAGPPQSLTLMFKLFNMELYTVDPLLSQPAQPMFFCPTSAKPVPPPPPLVVNPPPPSPPSVRFPPMPPVPSLEASACPSRSWVMPQYRCYWKVVGPDTRVAVAFGLIAARKYGTEMTLWDGLQGRGQLYRTLLREATTALLNSYNSIRFTYDTLSVILHMNWALMGSPQQALQTALRFKRANSGFGRVPCDFTPCKY
ncbi:PREDICTED: uncharacterized protein LOC104605556 [Nelumbo nucifera]|uniref:Uncharacterized protein LOC104605556 n=2 Tax=Nelumbo nucifera TaxID=4432 RepID=A0A1U8ALM0_NELNU|nr:PREDICTED: uncharacterized protein LOC104605556 [Nelumbo nucifera]DAD22398.1 TPA_asm: hypothetical protein HUJ06_023861 [Nelumbo nucifera]